MSGYRTPDGAGFTHASVERAFRSHQAAGLIIRWKRMVYTKDSGTRANPLYIVELHEAPTQHIATLWEAYSLVCGLASARQVYEHRLAVLAVAGAGVKGWALTSLPGDTQEGAGAGVKGWALTSLPGDTQEGYPRSNDASVDLG